MGEGKERMVWLEERDMEVTQRMEDQVVGITCTLSYLEKIAGNKRQKEDKNKGKQEDER